MSQQPANAGASKAGEAASQAAPPQGRQGADRLMISVVLIAAVAFFLFLLSNARPEKMDDDSLLAAAEQYAAPGDRARAEIAGLLQRGQDAIDQDEIYREAEQFRSDGAMADAYILYFFAARKGHGPSALRLGMMADPAFHDAYRDVFAEPDLFQSLKWYRLAQAAGIDEARAPLDRLIGLIRQRAADGDVEARRLLLEVE